MKGVTILIFIILISFYYFNSHAREGRDVKIIGIQESKGISTHTPVKGVTETGAWERKQIYISTHTPVKGVTFLPLCVYAHLEYFNSHAREGRDKILNTSKTDWKISTHTPVKGVTSQKHAIIEADENFNSHAREGRDVL